MILVDDFTISNDHLMIFVDHFLSQFTQNGSGWSPYVVQC